MSQEFDDLTFQIDHVIAVSRGGPTRFWSAARRSAAPPSPRFA
ncbi:hypothetical protein FRUB_04003 [Fimbriiglobus ruber]|uniref:Uncharacterized protein n=1 Tax=Fimbriiglobus ruber TaxID=1908690 RepID=A0A225DZX1_9BACT|nr:hypothetical protein FRUB_04003 [Fimbriiglobus ruber]